MRDFLGAMVGVSLGAVAVVVLKDLQEPGYPVRLSWPLWVFLTGTQHLHPVSMTSASAGAWIQYALVWALMGAVAGIPATSRSNCMRTSVWMGGLVLLGSLTSALLLDPTLWTGDRDARNWALFLHFVAAMLASGLSVPGWMTTATLKTAITRRQQVPPPLKIETVCTCGAVFKSNPLVCAYCGRQLEMGAAEDEWEECVGAVGAGHQD